MSIQRYRHGELCGGEYECCWPEKDPDGELVYYDDVEVLEAKLATAQARIAELVAMNELYNELLMAVGSKYEGETRHETALRYIREREGNVGLCCGRKDAQKEAGK